MTNQVGDIWECMAEWTHGVERASIVFHREVTAVTDTSESALGQKLCDDLVNVAQTATSNHMGAGTLLVCCTARRIPPADPTRIFVKYGDGTVIVGNDPVEAQSAFLFSMYPDSGAEIDSGRNYLPFLDRLKQDAGQILQTNEAGLLSDFGVFLLDEIILAAIADLKPVLYRKATEILPAVIVDIVEMILRPVMASQRRRVQHHQNFA